MLINAVDRLGRRIDPVVLDAAHQIAPRAIRYAEKLLGDPALATDLLEESAAAVSRVLASKNGTENAHVRNLSPYLFRAFIRRVNKARRKHPTFMELTTDNPTVHHNWASPSKHFEYKVLVDEFLTCCDHVTRDMFYRRVRGFSWREIGKVYGISSHAAESRFSQALQRVRKKLKLR